MKTLTIFIWLAAASLLQAATVNWTEYDANGLQIANGTFATVCASFLSVGSACSEPSPFSATATHFSLTGSASASNIDGLNTLLVATATVTSTDGTRGSVNLTWDELFFPDPAYLFNPANPTPVVDSYVMTGGFALSSPDANDTIVANKSQDTVLGSVYFDPLTANAAGGPSFSVGPDTQNYASNFGNGLFTHLSVTFNFLGATVVAGDSMDIPVSSTSSPVPEPATVWLACGALGVLAVRRWRTSSNDVPAGPRS